MGIKHHGAVPPNAFTRGANLLHQTVDVDRIPDVPALACSQLDGLLGRVDAKLVASRTAQ